MINSPRVGLVARLAVLSDFFMVPDSTFYHAKGVLQRRGREEKRMCVIKHDTFVT